MTYLAFLMELRLLSVRHTDGRMDRQTQGRHIYRASIASRNKKRPEFNPSVIKSNAQTSLFHVTMCLICASQEMSVLY